ncbi:hypothetical protein DFH28DRAFT_940602 [Melampsora americana]|nr:hypothetical protein DFH28DRAFT_940602 [Melampsora americana]
MTPAHSSNNPGKKQRANSKAKANEKRSNPSTPTPQPKSRPAQRQGRNDPEAGVPKVGSHMDPGLTPVTPQTQEPEDMEGDTTDQDNAEDPTEEPDDAAEDHEKVSNDHEISVGHPVLLADGEHCPRAKLIKQLLHSEQNATETSAGEEDEAGEETDIQTKLKGITFKKNAKEEAEEVLTHTQKMRAVQIEEARAQYDEVRAIHDELAKSIKKLEERAKQGAIDKSLHILKSTCNKINREMKEKEEELLMTLSSDHPDVIFVPMVFDPTEPATQRPSVDLQSSSPAPSKTKPTPVAQKPKRKGDSPAASQDSKNPRKKMKLSDYALDEATECDKETAGDVSITRRSRRPPYKSPRFVDPEDMEPEGPGAEETEENVVYVATAKGKRKEGKKEGDGEEVDLESIPELFRKATKPDLSLLLQDPTEEEKNEMRIFRESMTSHQFNYGETLSSSVCNVITTWNFDDSSVDDKIQTGDLAPHINYIMELLEDDTLMTKRLKTSPRLMQVSAKDPFITENSFKWEVLQESTRYPFKSRNGVFRSLHAMLCRTSSSPDWTDDAVLKGHVKNGYMILHNMLSESLELISFDSIHDNIVIQTEGDFAVPKQFISARSRSEGSKRVDRVANASIGSLQRQFFLVMLGVMLVYESEMYNSKRLRTINASGPSSEKSSRTIIRSVKPPPLSDAEKKDRRQIQNKVNHDASELRRDALQHMAMFFMYGTASFFHVWPASRDQTLQDAASLVNLASILADRRWDSVGDKRHVYGARAWNRLDDLMFDALKKFVSNGNFRTQIDWPWMTSYFSENFEAARLANFFTMDMLSEIHIPSLSRGFNGLVQEQVDLPDKEEWLLNAPATESFRALWGPTEGPTRPVTNRGKSMYVEVDEDTGAFAKQANPDSRMTADQEKADADQAARPRDKGEGSSQGKRTQAHK